jgi:hypothetical protein
VAVRKESPPFFSSCSHTEIGILYSDDNSMKPNNGAKIFYERIAEAMAKTGRPAHIEGSNLVEYLSGEGGVCRRCREQD